MFSRKNRDGQIGVFLAYAIGRGHALIDRALYLPETWTSDRQRCRAAGIPEQVEFATKPRLGMAMLERVLTAGVPFSWVTADEAYGQVKYLRVWLDDHDAAYVLATRRNDTLIPAAGGFGFAEQRADALIAGLDPRAWRRLSVGAGAHGVRLRVGAGPDPHRLATRTRALAARPPHDRGPR